MEIIDLEGRYEGSYCSCLEDWSEEMREAGDYKRVWLERKRGEGLRVKLARDGEGRIVGMIHYAPIEAAPALGEGLYYVYCVWVHAYKEGVGDRRGRGIGSALLQAAEDEARALGAGGLAAWGLGIPVFMRSSFFKRRGYRVADRDGPLELVWKPFTEGARPPRLLRARRRPEAREGLVTITCLRNGWCPAQNLAVERALRVAAAHPGKVECLVLDTEDRPTLEDWGMADALFVDARAVRTGPPPSYERLESLVGRRLRALERRTRAAARG